MDAATQKDSSRLQPELVRADCTAAQSDWALGLKYVSEYRSWASMIARCKNPNLKAWKRYGGRGISVCNQWADSFRTFLSDMGQRPEGTSLDRIDNDGNYDPSNCRWATAKQQARNRRKHLLVTHNGQTKCASEWSEITGIAACDIRRRLRLGWTAEQALTIRPTPCFTPIRNARIAETPSIIDIGRVIASNTSGFAGVAFHRRDKKWQATARRGKQHFHLGYFVDKADAIAAVRAKHAELQEAIHAS